MWWKNKEQLDWSKAGTVMAGDTLPRMFWNAVGERGDRVIILVSDGMSSDLGPNAGTDYAKELADDLKRFLDDLPISARRPSWGRIAVKWARRHGALVRSLGVLIVAALVILAVSTFLLARKQRELIGERNRAARLLRQAVRAESIAEAVNRFLTRLYLSRPGEWLVRLNDRRKNLTGDFRVD